MRGGLAVDQGAEATGVQHCASLTTAVQHTKRGASERFIENKIVCLQCTYHKGFRRAAITRLSTANLPRDLVLSQHNVDFLQILLFPHGFQHPAQTLAVCNAISPLNKQYIVKLVRS